ncbi:MAG: GerMN domain-containing protein [Bacilli bacterium]|nr:GerMN domain-containing protein [Bacilli bacterium]
MKKKIILIIFLAILIAILFIIPKDTYKKIFGKHDDEVINVEDYEKIFVYMNNEDDKLIGVNAYVYSLEEDLIRQKFDVLTMQTGIFNEDYDTTINTFTKLIDYNVDGNVLELNLSSEFLNSESRNTIEQLVWTYCDDEISELRVSVENEPINNLNGFYFDKLDKNIGINLTLETSYLFESTATTIIEYKNDQVIPVTYLYTDCNECDYIVSKLLQDIYYNKEYDYEVKSNSIIIDVGIEYELNDDLKKSIEDTIKYNLNINNIKIMGLESVLLEINENTGL